MVLGGRGTDGQRRQWAGRQRLSGTGTAGDQYSDVLTFLVEWSDDGDLYLAALPGISFLFLAASYPDHSATSLPDGRRVCREDFVQCISNGNGKCSPGLCLGQQLHRCQPGDVTRQCLATA